MTAAADGVRPAGLSDITAMRDIERDAGEAFREVGLPSIADDEPPSAAALTHWIEGGRAWVAAVDDQVVGYVVVDVIDHHAHIAQVSVTPSRQGAGIGRALLDTVAGWAVEHGYVGLSLTTFRDVPWNAPLFAHLGFTVVPPDGLSPELAALVEHEAAIGIAVAPRVVMRRDLFSQ